MRRSFKIDRLVTTNKEEGTEIKYACLTRDGETPLIRMSIKFDDSVPSEYKKALGTARGDTFDCEFTTDSQQSKLMD